MGEFNASAPTESILVFYLAEGEGDEANGKFVLYENGILNTAEDFEMDTKRILCFDKGWRTE